MAKFRVSVSGVLDWEYEIEADDKWDAAVEAEDMFQNEFHQVTWSGVDTHDVEEIDNES